jgi:hypothetical protein
MILKDLDYLLAAPGGRCGARFMSKVTQYLN